MIEYLQTKLYEAISACVVENKSELQDGSHEPSGKVCLDVMESKPVQVQDGSDEPSGKVCLDDMESKSFDMQDNRDEPSGQVCLDDMDCKSFEVRDDCDEPNVSTHLADRKRKTLQKEDGATKLKFLPFIFDAFRYLLIVFLAFKLLVPVGGSASEIEKRSMELGALVRLRALGCADNYIWTHLPPNERETYICDGMNCGRMNYAMEKDDDNSCYLTFPATEETTGTYRNADFHKQTVAKSFEVRLSVGGSASEIEKRSMELGALVRLRALGCSENYIWNYLPPNEVETKICEGMNCGRVNYTIEKADDNSCYLTFRATEETTGTYRNADFNNPTISKSIDMRLSGKKESMVETPVLKMPESNQSHGFNLYFGIPLIGVGVAAAGLMIAGLVYRCRKYRRQVNEASPVCEEMISVVEHTPE